MQSERVYYCPLNDFKTCNDIYLKRSAHANHFEELEKIPSELTNYFLFQKKLGSGSNGIAFQIYDENDEMSKAMKLLDVVMKERKKELKMLLRLHHQYIVRYFTSGKCENKTYIIMEACDMNLNEYMIKMQNKLTYEKTIRLLIQICQGIEYIHHHPEVKFNIFKNNYFSQSYRHL